MTDRRHFLKSLAAGCAASLAVPSILQAKDDNKVKPINPKVQGARAD